MVGDSRIVSTLKAHSLSWACDRCGYHGTTTFEAAEVTGGDVDVIARAICNAHQAVNPHCSLEQAYVLNVGMSLVYMQARNRLPRWWRLEPDINGREQIVYLTCQFFDGSQIREETLDECMQWQAKQPWAIGRVTDGTWGHVRRET